MKTMETTEEVSSRGLEKRVKMRNWQRITPFAKENRGGLEKGLANLWSRQKIAKNHPKDPRWSWVRNHMGNVTLCV
jgi:hypothetical protein